LTSNKDDVKAGAIGGGGEERQAKTFFSTSKRIRGILENSYSNVASLKMSTAKVPDEKVLCKYLCNREQLT